MMWPFTRRRPASPSPDVEAAMRQMDRTLDDVRALDGKVERAAKAAAEIARVNHVAAAVRDVLRGAT